MQATAKSTDYLYILDIDITPLHIDWTVITHDLKEHHYPYLRQAYAIGRGWSSFQAILNGSQPRFGDGHALLILHTKVCGTRLTEKRFVEFMQAPTPDSRETVLIKYHRRKTK